MANRLCQRVGSMPLCCGARLGAVAESLCCYRFRSSLSINLAEAAKNQDTDQSARYFESIEGLDIQLILLFYDVRSCHSHQACSQSQWNKWWSQNKHRALPNDNEKRMWSAVLRTFCFGIASISHIHIYFRNCDKIRDVTQSTDVAINSFRESKFRKHSGNGIAAVFSVDIFSLNLGFFTFGGVQFPCVRNCDVTRFTRREFSSEFSPETRSWGGQTLHERRKTER